MEKGGLRQSGQVVNNADVDIARVISYCTRSSAMLCREDEPVLTLVVKHIQRQESVCAWCRKTVLILSDNMEDCCVICAEPMQFTAYGPCGHKEACSKCVTRLRFVLKDKRCVICQQPHPAVFVTKYLGDYTLALSANAFEDFEVTCNCS